MYYSVGTMCEWQERYESEINIHIFKLSPFVYVHIETRTARTSLSGCDFNAVDGDDAPVWLHAHLVGDIEMKIDNLAVFEHRFECEAEIMVSARV